MHGFLNVFFAAALAVVHDLDVDRITTIIADDDPDSFRFEDSGIAWRDLTATAGQLRSCRSDISLSIGSCSFDEPREDLRALGWLASESG